MADNFFDVVPEVEDYDISKKLQSIVDSNFKTRARKRRVRNVVIVISVLLLFSFLAYNFQDTITGLTVEEEPEDVVEEVVEEEVVEEEPEEEVEEEFEEVEEELEEEVVEETEEEGEDGSVEIPAGGDEVVDGEEGGAEDEGVGDGDEGGTGDEVPEEEVEEEIEEEVEEEPVEEAEEPVEEEIPEEEIEDEEEPTPDVNITTAPSLIKNIPDYEFNRGGFIVIDVLEYFSNADEYYFLQVEGISSTISNNLILVQAEGGFDGTRKVNIIAENGFGQIESNFFDVVVYVENVTEEVNVSVVGNISGVNISTLQYKAIINKPTKWIKKIDIEDVDRLDNLSIELPLEASNISVKTGLEVQEALNEIEEFETMIENSDRSDLVSGLITGNVVSDIKEGQGILTRFFNWFRGFTITGNVISEEELSADITEEVDKKIVDLERIVNETRATEIAIEYYTFGPTAVESEISNGKRVVVSGPTELNYTDVLAFAEIEERFDVGQESLIRVYWREEGRYVDSNAFDLDGDGKLDYVEWVAPHLSNQTFDIILITKAEHLDSNREFISDIYDEVKELDNVWSEAINDSEYVRVTFEVPLDSSRDITLWPRTVSGTPRIEVYEVNGTELIAEFVDLVDNEYNKVFLDGSSGAGLGGRSQDVFDLRVVGGSIEIDHVIDPVGADSAFQDGVSHAVPTAIAQIDNITTTLVAGNNTVIAIIQFENTQAADRTLSAGNIELRRGTGATDPLLSESQFSTSLSTTTLSISDQFVILMGNDTNAPANPTYAVHAAASATGVNAEVKFLIINGAPNSNFTDGGDILMTGGEDTLATLGTNFPDPSVAGNEVVIIASIQVDTTVVAARSDIAAGNIKLKRGATVLASNQFLAAVRQGVAGEDGFWVLLIARDNATGANPIYTTTVIDDRATDVHVESKILAFSGLNSSIVDTGDVAVGTTRTQIGNATTTVAAFPAGDDVIIAAFQHNNVDTVNTIDIAVDAMEVQRVGEAGDSSNEFVYSVPIEGDRNENKWDMFVRKVTTTTGGQTYEGAMTAPVAGDLTAELKLIAIHIKTSAAADTTPPNVTINFPANVTYGAADLPFNFNVSLSENGTARYSLDGGVNNVTMSSTDNQNFNATNGTIADGSYTFSAYANDTAGNDNFTESVTFHLDQTFPLISYGVGTEADGANITADAIFVNVTITETNYKNTAKFSYRNL